MGVSKAVLYGVMAFCIVGAVIALVIGRVEKKHEEPIIVFITLDTVRARALSCYGNERETTPNIDALAKEGALFKKAYSNIGYTPSSHASMFSGLYPNRHSVDSSNSFFSDVPLLAEILSANNMVTSAAVVSPPLEKQYGLARGFDEYHENVTADARLTIARKAIRKADDEGRGAFLFLHYLDAHASNSPNMYDAPKPFAGRWSANTGMPLQWKDGEKGFAQDYYRRNLSGDPRTEDEHEFMRARYEECVSYLDFEVGRVIKMLKELGAYDRATIIITSDHGECIGEHDRYEHGHVFEEVNRIPLIIKPSKSLVQKPAGPIGGLTELVDLFPTILDAASIVHPMNGIDGRSIWACVKGELTEAPKEMVFGQIYVNQSYLRKGRYKIVRMAYRFEKGADTLDHLYDLEADPSEKVDLSKEQPEKLRELQGYLEHQLARSNKPLSLILASDGTIHHFQIVLTTEGSFRIETLLKSTYAFNFSEISEKRIVIDDARAFYGRWYTFDSIPVDAPVTIRIKVDGVPLPSQDIYIGSNHTTVDGLATFLCSDPSLMGPLAPDARTKLGLKPSLIILRTTTAPSKRFKIDADTRARWKELGYL